MNHRKLTLMLVALAVAGFGPIPAALGGSLPAAYQSCETAIAEQLGEGRLRTSILQNSSKDGVGYHWINVRHKADGADETLRYRARCETEDGAQIQLNIEPGAWKKTRPNRAPMAVD